jgi:anti-sigma-K factor RskA
MSQPDTQPRDPSCGVDVAAYALGALEPVEAEAFATHLKACAHCRDELAEFEQVVNALPASAPQHRAPRRLRRNVMRTVRSEASTAPVRANPDAAPSRSPRLRPVMARPAFGLAAAVLILAVGVLGGLALQGGGGSSTRVYAAHVIGSGTAELRVTAGRGELIVHHLDAPPAGEVYEVWLVHGRHSPSPTTALFGVTAQGSADVAVPGNLHGVNLVMVTPEPAGGTRVPTHPPVIRAQLI